MATTKNPHIYTGLILLVIGFVFTQCNTKVNPDVCSRFNEKSAVFYQRYYLESNASLLDSALIYINLGLDKCEKHQGILTLRKLSVLSVKDEYDEAISFIKMTDNELFSDLPYFNTLLYYRFKAMKATHENNNVEKEKYLLKCIKLIDNYLTSEEEAVDSLFHLQDVNAILNDPLSTALTQYYYYQAQTGISENVQQELENMAADKSINIRFIEYLTDYLDSDFLEFDGI